MRYNKVAQFFILSLLVCLSNSEEAKSQESQWSEYVEELIEKIIAQITKIGFRITVSPTILRTTVKQVVQKLLKVSLTKSTLKKIPIIGAITGVGFGIWRTANGEYGRAAAQVASGLAGATGFGIGPSIAIDIGIIIADVIEALIEEGVIKKNDQDFYKILSQKGISDNTIQILKSEEIKSFDELNYLKDEDLKQLGIKLGEIARIRKIN